MEVEAVDRILREAASLGASDVHFFVGRPPVYRINGVLTETANEALVTPSSLKEMITAMLHPEQLAKLEAEKELDISYQVHGGARFRVNIHLEKAHLGMVARVISDTIPTMEELRMEQVIYELTNLRQGLILVTGPTGCGKSTTLASMLEYVNSQRKEHIVTLEDPIEYLFDSKQSIVRQRELYQDFLSFEQALKHVVRQDPNIIMVGEMRDLETISAALTVAETGHLVLATLHTLGSGETIDRIIDVFPPHQQQQIRTQLASELRAIISQELIPRVDGGRVAAREILINTPAVSNLIRENKVAQIRSVLQTGSDVHMMTFDQSVRALYEEGVISNEEALKYVSNPDVLG